MAEYIKRESVLAKIDEFVKQNIAHGFPVDVFDIEMMKKMVEKLPAADVARAGHGQWVYGCQCSVCGDRHGPYNSRHRPYYNYCPNCGAKMDEEVNT